MLHVNHAQEPHVNQDFHTECCMLTIHGSHTLRFPHWMLHINHAWEPHVNQDLFISHSFSKRIIKIPLDNPCMWVTTLSAVKSVTNTFILWVKRPKKKRNSNLWEVCFSSAAVVSKLLLGCWGHFLYILCHCNSTAHSVMCTVHM